MVEAAASAIAVKAYQDGCGIFGYISKKIKYADDFKDNFEKMIKLAGTLYARRDDVKAKISNNKMKRATKECEDWIKRVKDAEDQVLKLESKYNRETTHAWRLPRFCSRANLSKEMAQKHVELQALLEDGKFNNRVLAERPWERVIVIDAPRTEDKPSLHWAVKEILGFMSDREVRKIGLWGMAGNGKTTIMQNLNNNEEVGNMFDIVIWLSVSENWSIKKVQDAIKRRLNLKAEGVTTTDETAQLISNELRGIRYLLLLDEVWHSFDLRKIGISNNDRDSKVVLASRSRVLCLEMDANELVHLKRMSPDDAFKMFEETVKQVSRSMEDPDIILIAKVVVRECAGLPLLIDKFAKTFRKGDNIRLWKEGLKNLRRWPSNKFEGMKQMIELVRFCYEHLNGDDIKKCFLYGALFPEECDICVNYLMECWKAEGFLLDIVQLQDARDRGHKILADLKDVSMLEEGATKEHVRMNKVIRKMALKISQDLDRKLLARTCEELKEAPKEEEWASSSQISLIGSDLHSLPATPNCINLSTLLLPRNNNLMSIPESFFLSMKRLRVLDLQQSAIQSLPSSLSFLTDLRALYLNSCTHLTKLPSSLGGLLHLEVLDIRGTRISSPIQVRCLAQMKCLRMSSSNFGTGGQISKVISSLTLLEELIIELDPNTMWSDRVVMTIIKEVSSLTQLTLLTFSFPKVEGLEIFITSSHVWKDENFTFRFVVGICDSVEHDILDYYKYPSCRFLKYAKDEGVRPVISKVLTKTNVFELIDHKNISSLSDFTTENMTKLRACSVDGCEDITCIIDGAAQPTFQYLDRMVIKNAPSLHCIWRGDVHGGSLGRMNSLTLYNCPKLKEIFSEGLIEQLAKLEHLSVEECHEIEEIIIEFENHCLDRSTLPKLKKLVLRDLPKLRSITPDDSLSWPSLERVEIASCRSLLKLPFSGENAVILRSINIELSWWSTWQDDAVKQRLHSFCNFT